MNRFFYSAALALLGLGMGASTIGAAPAQAATCVQEAALDLNSDSWIDTAEFHMALDAGFQNIRSGGKQYVSQDEMRRCLQGGPAAFRWLQTANPRYMSYSRPADQPVYASNTRPLYAPGGDPQPGQYYSTYDSGAAYDTPALQAHQAALAHLRSKVFGNPTYTAALGRDTYYQPTPPVGAYYPVPSDQTMAPAAGGPLYAARSEFSRIDSNGDGVITRAEYFDYMTRTGRAY
jgi:hypothetical protein